MNISQENYKIFDNSEFATILPNDDIYEYALFFFAGFNEDATKYIYILKLFIEEFSEIHKIKLKIIIPFLPIYKKEEYNTSWIVNPTKFTKFYAWYSFTVTNTSQGPKFQIIYNEEKNIQVIKLISDEIKLLGSSEKIIFTGFSMGGRYLLELLTILKIKTLFNVAFKSMFTAYVNPHKDALESSFNENFFYLYYSLYDKTVIFNRALTAITTLKENGLINVKVKIDSSKKHIVDKKCLVHLEDLLVRKIKNNSFSGKSKF